MFNEKPNSKVPIQVSIYISIYTLPLLRCIKSQTCQRKPVKPVETVISENGYITPFTRNSRLSSYI